MLEFSLILTEATANDIHHLICRWLAVDPKIWLDELFDIGDDADEQVLRVQIKLETSHSPNIVTVDLLHMLSEFFNLLQFGAHSVYQQVLLT